MAPLCGCIFVLRCPKSSFNMFCVMYDRSDSVCDSCLHAWDGSDHLGMFDGLDRGLTAFASCDHYTPVPLGPTTLVHHGFSHVSCRVDSIELSDRSEA